MTNGHVAEELTMDRDLSTDGPPTSLKGTWLRDWIEFQRANPTISTKTCVRRCVAEGQWLWEGSINGVGLTHFTTDTDVRPEMRPILTQTEWGAEMVGQDGTRLAVRTMRH